MDIVKFIFIFLYGGPIWVYHGLWLLYVRLTRPKDFNNTREALIAEKLKTEGFSHPHVEGVTHEQIESEGLSIHVARAGLGSSKPLLLFIHGFPEFWYSWRKQIEALQADYEIAAVDMPGYNASDKPADLSPYTSESVCACMAGVLSKLGRSECTLVGHDWGSIIAWDFAALYPEKVQKLAILSVVPGKLFVRNMDLKQMCRSYYMYLFAAPHIPELLLCLKDYAWIKDAFIKPPIGMRTPPADLEADIEHFKNAIAQPGAVTATVNYYRASLLCEGTKLKKAWTKLKLKMPVLFIYSDSDSAVTPNSLSAIGSVADNIHVQVLPNCSHWIQQDSPQMVNKLLKMLVEGELPLKPLEG